MKSIRVLIVDDSAVIRKIVGRCLRHAGIDLQGVTDASNGMEGLAVIRKGAVVEALPAGARGYIRKPFTPDQVKERVAPLLEGLR